MTLININWLFLSTLCLFIFLFNLLYFCSTIWFGEIKLYNRPTVELERVSTCVISWHDWQSVSTGTCWLNCFLVARPNRRRPIVSALSFFPLRFDYPILRRPAACREAHTPPPLPQTNNTHVLRKQHWFRPQNIKAGPFASRIWILMILQIFFEFD